MLSKVLNALIGKSSEPGAKAGVLDQGMHAQLKTHFEKIQHPVELVASLDDQPKSHEMRQLLEEISTLSDKISVNYLEAGTEIRKPSFSVARQGEPARIRFAGLPLGHELTSLVLAILQTSGHPPKVDTALIERICAFQEEWHFETYITLSCHNCPDAVQAFNLMATMNPWIRHTMIDGLLFRNEIDQLKIDGVPTILLNGKPFERGKKTLEEFVKQLESESGTS